jgi:hypothetical protein
MTLLLATWRWLLPLAACACFAAFGVVERLNYLAEKAGRAADRAADVEAVLAANRRAQAVSDLQTAALEAATAHHARVQTTYVDRIIHDPPSVCPPSAAARDVSRGLRELLAPGGGEPAAR